MKKILLGVVLGFILNSGLRSYHNYRWFKVESTFTNQEMNELRAKCNYFCVEERAVDIQALRYVLVYPWYNPQVNTIIIQYP